jgi:CBS domain-containing protein
MEERRAFLQVVEITRVMSSPPIVISPNVTVPQAARLLVDHQIGCLPVLEDGKLVGLVTESDVLGYLAGPLTGRN